MNFRQSRLVKLVVSGFFAISALLGVGSAMAYDGSWAPAALEGQSFSYSKGDFVRYGVTDLDNCSNVCLGRWIYKGFTSGGTMACNNSIWGSDPYPGRAKNCEKLTGIGSGAGGNDVNYIAVESNTNIDAAVTYLGLPCTGGDCSYVYYIAFGGNGVARMNYAPRNSSQTCSNASLGDPWDGVVKHCFIDK